MLEPATLYLTLRCILIDLAQRYKDVLANEPIRDDMKPRFLSCIGNARDFVRTM